MPIKRIGWWLDIEVDHWMIIGWLIDINWLLDYIWLPDTQSLGYSLDYYFSEPRWHEMINTNIAVVLCDKNVGTFTPRKLNYDHWIQFFFVFFLVSWTHFSLLCLWLFLRSPGPSNFQDHPEFISGVFFRHFSGKLPASCRNRSLHGEFDATPWCYDPPLVLAGSRCAFLRTIDPQRAVPPFPQNSRHQIRRVPCWHHKKDSSARHFCATVPVKTRPRKKDRGWCRH